MYVTSAQTLTLLHTVADVLLAERLAKLREDQMYEEEMFWSGQMFVQDWSPVSSPPADMPATPEPLPDMGFVTEIRDDSEESWEFLD